MIPLGLTFRRGGQASLLCGLATLRAKYFLFTLAKAQAEPQRNCGPSKKESPPAVKNKKAMGLLKKGYRMREVASISGVSINTVTKIKKMMSY
jgi:hypothetical protein